MAVTRDMCLRALDTAFAIGFARLHDRLIDGTMHRDSDAVRQFNRSLKINLDVYNTALAAIEASFAAPVMQGPDAPLAMDALHPRAPRGEEFTDYVDRKGP